MGWRKRVLLWLCWGVLFCRVGSSGFCRCGRGWREDMQSSVVNTQQNMTQRSPMTSGTSQSQLGKRQFLRQSNQPETGLLLGIKQWLQQSLCSLIDTRNAKRELIIDMGVMNRLPSSSCPYQPPTPSIHPLSTPCLSALSVWAPWKSKVRMALVCLFATAE